MGCVVTVGDSGSKRAPCKRRFSSVGGRNDRLSVSRADLVIKLDLDPRANERSSAGIEAGRLDAPSLVSAGSESSPPPTSIISSPDTISQHFSIGTQNSLN